MWLRGSLIMVALGVLGSQAGAQEGRGSMTLVSVRKIWEQAPHNAFTDLIRFDHRWFCVFREGQRHASPDGALRVITSADGETWRSAALVTSPTSDLRDAKVSVTPDGRLMLNAVEVLHDRSRHTHRSLAWFSRDGFSWSDKLEIGDPNYWLWRVTWHRGTAYGMAYRVAGEQDNPGSIRLYASRDGRRFDTLVDRVIDGSYPNEASLAFDRDTAYCLLRRDGQPLHSEPKSALLGVSEPPYTRWEWKDLGRRVGGPALLRLPDGGLVAGVRLHDGDGWHPAHTSLCWLEPRTGKLTEALRLPSGGDTSYPGLVLHDGLLWVSYYASHEGKTAVYLAKVKVHRGK